MTRSEAITILNVTQNASQEEIRKAYRNLVRLVHPDRFLAGSVDWESAQGLLVNLNNAYDILKRAPEQPVFEEADNQKHRRGGEEHERRKTQKRRQYRREFIPALIVAMGYVLLFIVIFVTLLGSGFSPAPNILIPIFWAGLLAVSVFIYAFQALGGMVRHKTKQRSYRALAVYFLPPLFFALFNLALGENSFNLWYVAAPSAVIFHSWLAFSSNKANPEPIPEKVLTVCENVLLFIILYAADVIILMFFRYIYI